MTQVQSTVSTGQSGEDSSAKASASFLKKRSKKLLIVPAAVFPDTASQDG
jgi:hypothetical protein